MSTLYEDLSIIQVFADGRTIPSVPSGTEILLIQDGAVSVGKLLIDLSDEYPIEIEHPTNEKELNILATKIVIEIRPEFLTSSDDIVAFCPQSLISTMIWHNT